MKMTPWVAAFANVVLPGSAYILLQKRPVFGYLFFSGTLLGFIHLWIDPLPDLYVYGSTTPSIVLGFIGSLLIACAFGYDAYRLAKE